MSDTFITVIAIMLSVVLVIVIPLVVTAQRVDDVSQLDVETLTSNFVDEIRTTGKMTEEDYDKFLQNLTATGNTYDVSLEFKILDENPGKKSMQTTKDKIGENVYYSIYSTQIEEILEKEGSYDFKQGDIVSITVRNTNLTLGQELKNFAYKIVGNDTYTISASNSGLVTGNGSSDVILADNVNENIIGYTLRENDENGTILNLNGEIKNKNGWTNQKVYLELYPTDSRYNLDLSYFWRKYNNTEDYTTGYVDNGNILSFDEKTQIQVYWKHSVLEKYSNVRTIDIKIDKIKPEIDDVKGSTTKGNTGKVTVSGCKDEGGSGLYGYSYVWTDKNEYPTAPSANELKYWTKSSASSFTITAYPQDSGKKCTVWVMDYAGNISDPKSDVVENIVPIITGVNLKDAIVKKGENKKIQVTLDGGTDYKSILFESSDTSKATINSEGIVTGINSGETEIKCTVSNYNGYVLDDTCNLTVVDLSYNLNGGNALLQENGKAILNSNVTISGADKAKYGWSTSNNKEPTSWTDYSQITGQNITETVSSAGTYYLWSRLYDITGNYVDYISNAFNVSADKIKITPSTTNWTNQNVECTITYPDSTISSTRKAAYGSNAQSAQSNSGYATAPTTKVTVTENGSVYAVAGDNFGNMIFAILNISYIDRTAPTCTISANKGSPTNASSITYTFTWSENVTGFDASDISVTNGTKGAFSGSGSRYSLVVTNSGSCTQSVTVNTNKCTDYAGNYNTYTSKSITIDRTAPTCTISANKGSPTNASSITYTFTWSENVYSFAADDISVTNGTKGTFSGSGRTYSLVVTNSGSCTQSVTVGTNRCTDSVGNYNNKSVTKTIAIDRTAPTCTINADKGSPTNASSITYTFTWSEDVYNFAADDISVTNGARGTFSGSGRYYTLVVTNSGSCTQYVTVNANRCTDSVGNYNNSSGTKTIVIDRTAPSLSVNPGSGHKQQTSSSTSNENYSTSTFTISIYASDASGINFVRWRWDSDGWTNGWTATKTCTIGLHTLYVEVGDNAGNVAYGSYNYRVYGWNRVGGNDWYYYDENGTKVTGWKSIYWENPTYNYYRSAWYYFDSSGKMLRRMAKH